MRLGAAVIVILSLVDCVDAGTIFGHRYTVQSPGAPITEDGFGTSLAAAPPYLLVGCPHAEEVPESAGLFDLETGTHLRTFLSPAGDAYESFGSSVALVGAELAVVGQPRADAVHVFDVANGNLVRTIPNSWPRAGFGARLSVLGSDLIVGTMDDVVYRIDPRSGERRQTYGSPAPSRDPFGRDVNPIATLGNDVLAAVTLEDGRAVQRYDADTGRPLTTYRDPAGAPSTEFGAALATLGRDVLVGAPGDGTGAVHRFTASGTLRRTYRMPAGMPEQRFGTAVAAGAGMIFVGAPYETITEYGYLPAAGALFVLSPDGRLQDRLDDPRSDSVNFGAPIVAAGNVVVAHHLGDTGRDEGLVHVFAPVGRQRVCGDGVQGPYEECDDGNLVDGDGCDSNCRLGICIDGVQLLDARLTLRRLGRPSGDEEAEFRGRLWTLDPIDYDPVRDGLQIEVVGERPIDELNGVLSHSTREFLFPRIPPGGVGSGCGPEDGWRADTAGTQFVYRNESMAYHPESCEYRMPAFGTQVITVTDLRAKSRGIEVVVRTRGSTIPRRPRRIHASVVLGALHHGGKRCAVGVLGRCHAGSDGRTLRCR
jgi:cysteine-rich repeat protein